MSQANPPGGLGQAFRDATARMKELTQQVAETKPAEVTAEDERRTRVKELRQRTDLPLLKCRQALMESNWDAEKALAKLMSEKKRFGVMYD